MWDIIKIFVCVALNMYFIDIFQAVEFWSRERLRIAQKVSFAVLMPPILPEIFFLQKRPELFFFSILMKILLEKAAENFYIPFLEQASSSPVKEFHLHLMKFRNFLTSNLLSSIEADSEPVVLSKTPFLCVFPRVLEPQICSKISKIVSNSSWRPAKLLLLRTALADMNKYDSYISMNRLNVQHTFQEDWKEKVYPSIERLTGLPRQNFDSSVMNRYYEGGCLYNHFDGGPDPMGRICTAIVCFQSPKEGGETCFPRLGVKIKLQAGDILIMKYTPDTERKLLHCSAPVISGEKIILNQFISSGQLGNADRPEESE
jgi:prolyl 4-hydroxylase